MKESKPSIQLSRRDFMKITALGTGVAVLSACAPELAKQVSNAKDVPDVLPVNVAKTVAVNTPDFSDDEILIKGRPDVLRKPKFLYYSQHDPKWAEIPNSGKANVDGWGCGIVTGGMITWSDPYKYWDMCKDIYGKNLALTEAGTNWKFHLPVLTEHGFSIESLGDKMTEIKENIRKFTSQGIPVWINARIFVYSPNGHNTMAIGVSDKDRIVMNDPYYGPNFEIADSYFDMSNWKVNAVVPPAH